MEHSDQTNPAWAACGEALVARKDAQLQQAWRRALPARAGAGRSALLRDQRRWILSRDRSCRDRLSGNGREGQVIDFPLCRAGFIGRRILWLQHLDRRSAGRR
jgi:uncharacterized protein YecT (DUF1311 family)